MNIEFAEWLVSIDNCDTQASLVDGYSGRGMCGRATAAVSTGDSVNLLLSAVREAVERPDDVPEMPDELMLDNLGKGSFRRSYEVLY